ncbi:YkoF family thiamine/hydroxymethylpyrimidine-binding protein [Moorella sulfitireducens]|uniref:YkoF family thiamine/hydroxymethylpyrimidine-binding protein n=1 Tax=Neomoorella sulfitireducens TaxID=2972948 RepID=UPI0021AC97D7|nr:YkoF family thiamine/hydroxymethylpyrimidine-binding protein [Moorella sulfitireducens]
MLSAEVSLYPQKTTRASEIINESIQSLARQGISYNVGPISTEIHGTEEQVWAGIRSLFDQASSAGEVSMVVTLSNAAR